MLHATSSSTYMTSDYHHSLTHCLLFVLSSLRNHMVFTPLLPQTTTGTLEFRAICEPIFNVQPALTQSLHSFIPAMVHGIDPEKKIVRTKKKKQKKKDVKKKKV